MKKFAFSTLLALLLAAVLALAGCYVSEAEKLQGARTLTLMTWNVHNLFDGKDDGDEYPEFLQSAGWSVEKYKGRLNSISAAIGKVEPLPDILVLQEIEHLQVLEDLAFYLPKGYSWCHFANNPGAAVGLGILSRLPISEAKSHSITINGDTTPRPVLETRIRTESGDLIIFICHWKSKIGGDDETEKTRRASANVILRRIREIWEDEPETGVIIAGDLNINHDEFFKRGSNVVCALLPDDSQSAKLVNGQKDFIVITGRKPPLPVYFPQETIVLYSPWIRDLKYGTYFYRNNWETIDHFLISHQFFGDLGFKYKNTFVADFEPFAGHNGVPVPYNQRTGNGLSDHLPLVLNLFF